MGVCVSDSDLFVVVIAIENRYVCPHIKFEIDLFNGKSKSTNSKYVFSLIFISFKMS